jgi:uncharacterized protein YdeI (YjbR/CyaY-like superfamily)
MPDDLRDPHVRNIFSADDAGLTGQLHQLPAEAGEPRLRQRLAQRVDDLGAILIARGFTGREKDMRIGRDGDADSLAGSVILAVMARLPMPKLLVDACDGDEQLLAWAGTLRESWQRWIARHVMQPASEETRQRRAERWAELMLQTMEAEQELPPALAARLRRTRYAAEGYALMSVNRRRDYLMTIFGARGMQARENQIMRWIEACVAKGARGGGGEIDSEG